MSERIGVADQEWAIIGPLLPPERGRCARPAHDNRRFFEGMLWMARTGSQWRQLPETYGKWNSVFRQFRRWTELGSSTRSLKALLNSSSENARPTWSTAPSSERITARSA